MSMIVTCESCKTRYLVPAHAISGEGRRVRCTSCDHEWFQEPGMLVEDAPPPVLEEELEPIPESVKPIPEGSELPVITEPPLSGPPRDYGALAGYAAAAGVFLLITAVLFMSRGPVTHAWPPAVKLYELAGIAIPVSGEGLIFDRVSALRSADERGGSILNIEGVVVNLKQRDIDVPQLRIALRNAKGEVFDSWNVELPSHRLAGGADVRFQASYPGAPNDIVEATVSFGAAAVAAKGHEISADQKQESEDHHEAPPEMEQHEPAHEEKSSGHGH